jgi:RimJ/RimL family protein N-acetyltransferase
MSDMEPTRLAMTQTRRLETERLTLVPATMAMLDAELTGREALARVLGADVASPWPPPLNDEASNRWVARHLEKHPEAEGWTMWYFLLRRGGGEAPIAVGNGGYKGAPAEDGTVEIGYSIVEAYQRRGLATEAAGALVGRAFEHAAVTRVIAETLPHLTPSIRVLEKSGFTLVGPGSEEGSIRFELARTAS